MPDIYFTTKSQNMFEIQLERTETYTNLKYF